MIHEHERRWPDWQGGLPVELPDGQCWTFYEPEGRTRYGRPGWTFGARDPDVDRVLSHRFGRIAVKWQQAESEADRASAMLEAAWFLLARNYSVTAEEFEQLLSRASAWPASRREQLWRELLALVGAACMRAIGESEKGAA